MSSKKTRPIGTGVRNVPVTLSNEEVLGLEQISKLSGIARSPYIRALIQWAIKHDVVLRPNAEEYNAYLQAIERGVSPLPKYRYEPAVFTFPAPAGVPFEEAIKMFSEKVSPHQKPKKSA
ncbi:MAG: hypothetical protein ACFUZC_16455 [Chthoniobacteraceae bacterium]